MRNVYIILISGLFFWCKLVFSLNPIRNGPVDSIFEDEKLLHKNAKSRKEEIKTGEKKKDYIKLENTDLKTNENKIESLTESTFGDEKDINKPINVITSKLEKEKRNISNIDFAQPKSMTEIRNKILDMSNFLSSLGLVNIPNIEICNKAPVMAEFVLCFKNVLSEIESMFLLAKEITTLNSRVMSGGSMANQSLERLKTLVSMPYGKKLMKILGTVLITQILMQRESTPDRQRWLAGSIITLVSDLPVATVVDDSSSGSFGHVNVVVPRPSRVHRPDEEIRTLQFGIDPIYLTSGPMNDLEGID